MLAFIGEEPRNGTGRVRSGIPLCDHAMGLKVGRNIAPIGSAMPALSWWFCSIRATKIDKILLVGAASPPTQPV
jgi:hypothetical protein